MDKFSMINEHEKIEMLLPWFVTGTLDAEETALVDAHLLECAECQMLCGEEYQLKTDIASVPIAIPEFGVSAAMNERRPRIAPYARQVARQAVSRWKVKPLQVAAFAAAQAAMLLIVFQLAQPSRTPGAEFRTLSSGEVANKANAIVMFNADTRESDFRALLMKANATIVGGPTESNAYHLRIEPAIRDNRLKALQENAQILLAQPIDGE